MPSDIEQALAEALHKWRKTQALAGCGWEFGSIIDGEAYCPCPADAAAILATEPMQVALRALAKDIGATAYAEGLHDAETNPERDRDAAVGRAVLRLADSVAWTLRGGPDGSNTEAWNTQTGAVGSGDTIPEAIAAALGDDHD